MSSFGVLPSSIVAEIEAGQTEFWLHEEQSEWVRGRRILIHLREMGLLSGCIGNSDLDAIKAQGLTFFREHFAGKAIPAWRDVGHQTVVLCLVEYEEKLVQAEAPLDVYWGATIPALRRKKE